MSGGGESGLKGSPQFWQNLAVDGFSALQLGQSMVCIKPPYDRGKGERERIYQSMNQRVKDQE
jgi:hypothetical protein